MVHDSRTVEVPQQTCLEQKKMIKLLESTHMTIGISLTSPSEQSKPTGNWKSNISNNLKAQLMEHLEYLFQKNFQALVPFLWWFKQWKLSYWKDPCGRSPCRTVSHGGAGEGCEESWPWGGGSSRDVMDQGTDCNPYSLFSCAHGKEQGGKTGSKVEPSKKRRVGGRCFKICFCSSLSFPNVIGNNLNSFVLKSTLLPALVPCPYLSPGIICIFSPLCRWIRWGEIEEPWWAPGIQPGSALHRLLLSTRSLYACKQEIN